MAVEPSPGAEPARLPEGLLAELMALDGAELAAFRELRRDWHARLDPIDEAERAACDAIVALVWRRIRLDALEARVMAALLGGRPLDGAPSLGQIGRIRARLEKDRAAAERELRTLWSLRPQPLKYPGLNPARLEWLAARMRAGRIRPWRPPAEPAEPAAPPAAGAGPPEGPAPMPPDGHAPPSPPPAAAVGGARASG